MLNDEFFSRTWGLDCNVVLDKTANQVSSWRLLPLENPGLAIWAVLCALVWLNFKAWLFLSRVKREARCFLHHDTLILILGWSQFLLPLWWLARSVLSCKSRWLFIHSCGLKFYFWNLGRLLRCSSSCARRGRLNSCPIPGGFLDRLHRYSLILLWWLLMVWNLLWFSIVVVQKRVCWHRVLLVLFAHFIC